ncbi:MAG: trigger factor [Crocinitomicaceae bacterium]|nr:trigger factor [Crocinitomicaceae bacterium]
MEVVEEKIDSLNAVLRVKVTADDYAETVDKQLNDYRKQANIPGFRPGKTPIGLIKKKYGKAVLAEELNKVVSKSLYDFIEENKLNILGNPLPKENEEVKGDFDNPADFEFVYEIGISPEFKVDLSKGKFDYLKIKIDGEMLDKEVDQMARRYGSLVSAEKASEKDMIMGEFTEMEGDNPKEGGVSHTATISLEFLEDKKAVKKLVGAKVGDEFRVDPVDYSKGEADLAAMLGVTKEDLPNISNDFNLKVTEIKEMKPAAIDQALFDKVFGEGKVSSEEEMRSTIEGDLVKMFANDSDRVFNDKVVEELLEKTKIDLPEEFLKRWILASSDKEDLTAEKIEEDFENYRKGLKWQLIQNNIIKDNDIKVEPAEAVDYVKNLLVNQYAQYGMPAPEDNVLEDQAKNVLGNRDEANKIYDSLYASKILQYFKETVKIKEKEVSYEDFVKEAYGK